MAVADERKLNWVYQHLKINNKRGELVALRANTGQLILHKSMQVQREAGLPVRIALLKPRQVGWSTWTEAEGFYDIYHRPNWNAMAVSLDADSTDVVFGMTKLFHAEMPNQRPTDNTNRKELIYSKPHRSRFVAQTAGKLGVGRSFRAQYLHCSEVAYWENADIQLAGLFQIVPKERDTVIVLESTANGEGGAFADIFWDAVERRQHDPDDYHGFLPVFFPWFKFPEYSTTPPASFLPTGEEEELAQQFDLTRGQLYWRRLKIEEMPHKDVASFKQEYPATALEAFQSSGHPVFTEVMINEQQAHVSKDVRYCVFSKLKIEDVNRRFNCWQIRKLPLDDHQYAIGADTMEDRLSDVQNPKSKLDCHGVVILDRTDGDVVALYHGRGPQIDVAQQVYWAAQVYNDAWIAPEVPKAMTLLNYLKNEGYENIYNRQVHDQRVAAEDSEELGWRTDLITRTWLVNDFIAALRDRAIIVGFQAIIDQMRTFIHDKTGKPIHKSGKHDDLLFGLMIALQVHIRCPVAELPYPDDYTGDLGPDRRGRSLCYAGAVDTDEDDEDDYFEGHTA